MLLKVCTILALSFCLLKTPGMSFERVQNDALEEVNALIDSGRYLNDSILTQVDGLIIKHDHWTAKKNAKAKRKTQGAHYSQSSYAPHHKKFRSFRYSAKAKRRYNTMVLEAIEEEYQERFNADELQGIFDKLSLNSTFQQKNIYASRLTQKNTYTDDKGREIPRCFYGLTHPTLQGTVFLKEIFYSLGEYTTHMEGKALLWRVHEFGKCGGAFQGVSLANEQRLQVTPCGLLLVPSTQEDLAYEGETLVYYYNFSFSSISIQIGIIPTQTTTQR